MAAPPPPPPPPPPPCPPPAAPSASGARPPAASQKRWHVDLPVEKEWKDVYPFHYAAQLGDAASLQAQLDAACSGPNGLLNAPDDDGWAPLHYAAWYGHLQAVRTLLQAGARPNPTNGPPGATPMHLAAGSGHAEVVQALLDAGADGSIRSAEKQTPAELCAQLKPEQHERIVRMLSCSAKPAHAVGD